MAEINLQLLLNLKDWHGITPPPVGLSVERLDCTKYAVCECVLGRGRDTASQGIKQQ